MVNKLKNFIVSSIYFLHLDFIFSYRSYSQDGEDMLLASFFDGQKKTNNFGNKNYRGFYVDVGGYHPYRYSNTAFFYKKKWRGINVEPTPFAIKEFHRKRKRDINLNIGISNYSGEMFFYQFNDSALNTFDERVALKYKKLPNNKLLAKVKIGVLTLEEMFHKYLPKNQSIDFMNVDVEGLDLKVLESNNWEKFRPKYLLVETDECLGIDIKNLMTSDLFKFLEKKDYMLVGKVYRTGLFKCKRSI